MTDAKGIAMQLSAAQRRFIAKRWGKFTMSGDDLDQLYDLGLVQGCITEPRLTDAGLAVRRELAAGRGDGDV